MRLLLVAVIVCAAAAAPAVTYSVPDEELNITEISQAMSLASAGDTVFVRAGVYDSVSVHMTPIGVRTAVVKMTDGVTLLGADRADVRIDQTESEYGILCMNVGPETVIGNLTVRATGALRSSPGGDDSRALVAGIACIEGASPTIVDVTIENVSTGVVVRSDTEPSAPSLQGVEIARADHHGVFAQDHGTTPVTLDHVTIVDNFDHGVYAYNGYIDVSNSNITHNRKNGVRSYLSTINVSYCNLYWNDAESDEPQNYFGMADLTGIDGNVSMEPFYCDYFGNAGYDYHVCFNSDLIGLGEGGTNIGAWGGGCSDCVSPVKATSWGAIKALYR